MAGAVARRRVPSRTLVAAVAVFVVACSAGAAAWIVHGVRYQFGTAALLAYLGLVALATTDAQRRSPRTGDRAGEALPLGVLATRILSPVFEGAILLPVAWVARGRSDRVAILALVAYGLAYLATYERAKAQGLRYAGRESTGFLVVRDGLLVLGLLSGWLDASLWAFVVLAALSAGIRAYNVAHQERLERRRPRLRFDVASQEIPR